MKVAVLVPTFFEYSGVDRVAEQQAKEYRQTGHEVTVFTFAANISLKDIKLDILGFPRNIYLQEIYRLIFPFDAIKTLRYVNKLKDYDLIISHHYPLNWLAYLTKKFYGVTYIYHHHPIGSSLGLDLKARIYTKLFRFMAKLTIKNTDSVISVSQFARSEFKEETGMDSKVSYNKIDMARFNGTDASEVKEKYNLRDEPIILFVGRIDPAKGIHMLIDSFNLVKKDVPNAKLLIVGKVTYAHDYARKIKTMTSDSIILAGYVPDKELPDYYAACNVYATASLWEGFNLPLAEAGACGKPVVAFDIGSHKEVIRENISGFLVPPYDCEALAKAIITILQDKELARNLGENGREFVRNNFSI